MESAYRHDIPLLVLFMGPLCLQGLHRSHCAKRRHVGVRADIGPLQRPLFPSCAEWHVGSGAKVVVEKVFNSGRKANNESRVIGQIATSWVAQVEAGWRVDKDGEVSGEQVFECTIGVYLNLSNNKRR